MADTEVETDSLRRSRAASVSALVAACRPRQWLKNVLVLAVPAAAGEVADPDVLLRTGLAFLAFCLASSATYLLNDLSDVEADLRHPVKRNRPIASGALSPFAATVALVMCGLAAVGIAAGFFLRAVAGGLAADIKVSQWFLIVAAGGSVFVVAGKRYAEWRKGGDGAAGTRSVLASYSGNYLESISTIAAAVTLLAYCLWAFDDSGELASGWRAASVVPFVLAIMRYGLLVDQGHGEEPEEIFTRDRTLQGIAVCWLGLLGMGVLL